MKDLKELEKRYKELGDEIERLKKKEAEEESIANDPIFLLSAEEYNKYKENIPIINCWWWLRSPGCDSRSVALVSGLGSVFKSGDSIENGYHAVRPALRYNPHDTLLNLIPVGDKFVYNGVTWVVIDTEKNLAIAEMPIGFEMFSTISNNYFHSYIRKWLFYWKDTHRYGRR